MKKRIQNFLGMMEPALIITGILLRLQHLLENRSFWLDEAYVALNLSFLSLKEILLFTPFQGHQAAPPMLFLLVEKLNMGLLGNNEIALRLFPFLCAIVSIFLFYYLCRKILDRPARWLALAIFVFSEPLIYYSAELKPYSTDLMFALIFFIAYFPLRQSSLSFPTFLSLGILGTIAIFFSFPSVFVLGPLGAILFWEFASQGKKAELFKITVISFWWAVSFLCLYFVSIRVLFADRAFVKVLSFFDLFPPVPFLEMEGTKDFFLLLYRNGIASLGIMPLFLWLIFIFAGIVRSWREDRRVFFLFLGPLILTLMSALLKKYPFLPRFLIFLVPAQLFFLAKGLLWIVPRREKMRQGVMIVIGLVLFIGLVKQGSPFWLKGREKSDIRQVMRVLKQEYKPGDAIFFNRHAIYGIGYYHGILGMGRRKIPMVKIDFPQERGDAMPQGNLAVYFFDERGFLDGFVDIKKEQKIAFKSWLENPRTWLILTHNTETEEDLILYALESRGKRKQSYQAKGAALYLFDLSQK